MLYALAEEGENTCFSPLLIEGMLGWIQSGTRGHTYVRLSEFSGIKDEQLFAEEWNALNKLSSYSFYNAIWPSFDLDINKHFIEYSKRLNAHIEKVDYFNSQEARKKINAFIASSTNNNIPELLPLGFLSPQTLLTFTNSLYYKGSWLMPFDSDLSYQGVFFNDDKSYKTTYMKKEDVNLQYVVDPTRNYHGVVLPFENNQSLVLLVPENSENELLENIDDLNLEGLSESMKSKYIRKYNSVVIPKFRVESEIDLKSVFSLIELGFIFSQEANLNGIANGISFDKGVHKTVIEINEQGAKIASASAISAIRSMSSDLVFDKPFIYAIYDQTFEVFLVVGVFYHP